MTRLGQIAPQISGVILAGGKSTRLGLDKAFLRLGSQTLIERTVEKLRHLSTDIIVVTNSPARYEPLSLPVRLVGDIEAGEGSLMGIYSGLQAARHPLALAVACDMPFLNLPLLRYMILMTHGHDVVVPYLDGYLEPLHAIYGRSCLAAMKIALQAGERRIVAFFDHVRVRHLDVQEIDIFDPHHLSMFNVNTRDDWRRVRELVSQQVGYGG